MSDYTAIGSRLVLSLNASFYPVSGRYDVITGRLLLTLKMPTRPPLDTVAATLS